MSEKKEAWEKDLVYIRVSNVERKGENLNFTVNGRLFQLENNKVHLVPRAVYHALMDAVTIEYQVAGDINKGKVITTTEAPRVMVQMLSEEQAEQFMDTKGKKEKKVMDEIIGASEPKKTFSKSDIQDAEK